jgi:hypothetical protein
VSPLCVLVARGGGMQPRTSPGQSGGFIHHEFRLQSNEPQK